MPIDARIPLGARSANIAPAARTILNAGFQGARLAQNERAIASRESAQAKNAELSERRIELEEARLDEAVKSGEFERLGAEEKRRFENNVKDSIGLLHAIDQGPQQAQQFIERNRARNERLGLDSRETDEAAALLNAGRTDELRQVLQTNVAIGERFGVITATQTEEPKTAIGKARMDLARGHITPEEFKSVVGQESGLKTPAEINQLAQIEQIKSAIQESTPKRQLEIQKAELDIDKAKQEIAANEQQKEKAETIKSETKRLAQELLQIPNGVRSAVGPFDSSLASPSFFPETLRAQTKINQLLSLLTVDNLGLMSGVLSESDIKILQAVAGGGLDVTGDDDAFIAELGRIAGIDPEDPTSDAPKPVSAMTDEELAAELNGG